MAPNTQTLVLDRITEKLEAQGLLVAIDFAYANTGTIRTFTEKLTLVSQMGFKFMDDYFQFERSTGVIASYRYGQVRERGTAAYVKSSIPEAINAVCDYLNS